MTSAYGLEESSIIILQSELLRYLGLTVGSFTCAFVSATARYAMHKKIIFFIYFVCFGGFFLSAFSGWGDHKLSQTMNLWLIKKS